MMKNKVRRILLSGTKKIGRKVITGMWMLFIMFSLSGCTLAVEDAGEEEELRDPMIGVFVTTEDLTMLDFDWDAYFEENIGDLVNGDEADLKNSVDTQKRIYATVDKHNSIEPSDWEVHFEDLEGYSFFNALWQMEDGDPFTMMTLSEEICDINQHYNYTDDSSEIQLDGTIYVTPAMSDKVYYANPVYQTKDGDIYVTPGGWGDHIGSLTTGTSLSMTISDEVKVTENGKTNASKMTVKLTYQGAYVPTEIIVNQMDANNQLIKTESYAPGKLPEVMQMEQNTAYIIVETIINNPEKPKDSIREIYMPEGESEIHVNTFMVTENGGLGKMGTRIEW